MTTPIHIDTRELGSLYVDLLQESLSVEIKTLHSADIVVHDLGIERKTVTDFFLTLQEGRLFQQLKTLKSSYRRQLLLIEGHGMRYHLDQDPSMGLYIRICAGWQIPIIHTQNGEQTATVIKQIFHQDIREPAGPIRPRPRNKRWREPPPSHQMLAVIPGIGPAQAAALLERFSTVTNVLSATTDELRRVHGIGKRRAAAIMEAGGGRRLGSND